jgi:hypothetical protein
MSMETGQDKPRLSPRLRDWPAMRLGASARLAHARRVIAGMKEPQQVCFSSLPRNSAHIVSARFISARSIFGSLFLKSTIAHRCERDRMIDPEQ